MDCCYTSVLDALVGRTADLVPGDSVLTYSDGVLWKTATDRGPAAT
jgi:hypothetical protein